MAKNKKGKQRGGGPTQMFSAKKWRDGNIDIDDMSNLPAKRKWEAIEKAYRDGDWETYDRLMGNKNVSTPVSTPSEN